MRVFVFVLSKKGEPLMPTSPANAKRLLKQGKAKVVKRTPFTIQLNYATGETKQDITLGVDTGYKAIGLSAVSDGKELFASKVELRTDNNHFIKFVRKCNRSLFKTNFLKGGKRKVRTIKEAFGFRRWDKVLYGKIECFIYGLRSSGYFDVRCLTGEKIDTSVKYADLKLIEPFKTWRIAISIC